MSTKALERHLVPLTPFLNMNGVTEVCINRPQEIFVEKQSKFSSYRVEELNIAFLESLAALIAEFNDKTFPSPLLSGSLPTGERIQWIMSPACEKGKIVCSIRRHQMRDMYLDDYVKSGAFDSWKATTNNLLDDQLTWQYRNRDLYQLIKLAISNRKNILISGGTGTGKTTFLNACLKLVPDQERLITVEDTREVTIPHENGVHLLFNEEDERMTSLNIFKACLRLRPDRIFLSELRGDEVWPYLRAANSGHPGSLSTIHADTPEAAISQLVFMMQQAGSTSSEEQLRKYIKSIIHVIVQLKRDTRSSHHMFVESVWLNND